MAKTLTRAEMRRAAMALHECVASDWKISLELLCRKHRVSPASVDETNPRFKWWDEREGWIACDAWAEASMLMSEAHRPAGHDGDGKDD